MAQSVTTPRQRALFALGVEAIRLARDEAITAEDLAAIAEVLKRLMNARVEEDRDAHA